MLRVDLREFRRGPVETTGQLAPDDPALAGLDLALVGPVSVGGVLQGSPDRLTFAWRGHLAARVRGACRRCLAEVEIPIDTGVEVVFSPDPDAADDPGVYPLVEPVTAVDVTPAVREELLLAAPAFVLCREDCAGLCARCGADLNAGPCQCGAAPEPA